MLAPEGADAADANARRGHQYSDSVVKHKVLNHSMCSRTVL